MSHRHGPPLIADAHVHGLGGLGILGADIPTTGAHGGSLLANDDLDPAKEYRILITAWPPGLPDLFVGEDGSLYSPPVAAGIYEGGEYEGFEDGVSFGSAAFSVTVGAAGGVVIINLLGF